MSDTVSSLILFVGISLTGWIFVGVALYTKLYQKKKEQNERSLSSGQIVDLAEKVNTAGRGRPVRYYVPVVEFEANNQTYRLENENGYREKEKIILGKSVDVMYDSNNPTHFHLTEDDANETSSFSLMRLGLIIIGGAALLAVFNLYFHLL